MKRSIVLSLGFGLICLGSSRPSGGAGKDKLTTKDDREIRLPVQQGPNTYDLFIGHLLSLALQADKDERASRFEFKAVAGGLRFSCNEINNRYYLDIKGTKVSRKADYKGSGFAFMVDGRELRVDSRPLTADTALDIEKEFKRTIADLEKHGLHLVEGSFQLWKFPGGEKAVYWELIPRKGPKATRLFQSTITYNRHNRITLIAPVREGEDPGESARLLRRTTLSLERLVDLPSHKAALTIDYLKKHGLTLRQTLYMREANEKKQHGALLNKELATPKDRRLPRTLALEPKELIRRVRLYLLLRQTNDTPVADRRTLEMTVFDGATAHVVRLRMFDREAPGFVYMEMWPKDTFLGKGNNRAGIMARPHPSYVRTYVITENELAKVLYSVQDEWAILEGDRIFLERFRKPKDEVVVEFRKLLPKGAQAARYHEVRLLAAGQCFLLDKQTKEATLAFQVCRTLHPDSVEALIGLADVQRLEGNKNAAAKLYRSALDELSTNKRLPPLKSERLKKYVQEHNKD
jgi:hypothetical protein